MDNLFWLDTSMKSKANTIVIAFILSALVLSICGCPGPGQTAGPGLEQTTNGESKAVAFLKGRELGRKHRNEQLRTYRASQELPYVFADS